MYKEINEHLQKARESNKESMEWILDKLNPLIISTVKKYFYRINDFEELLQEGRLVILECIQTYDQTKGTYFLGYAKQMLIYYFLDKNKEKFIFSLNEKIGPENEDLEIIDLLVSDEEQAIDLIISLEMRKEIVDALQSITLKQRQVVIDFYYGNMKIDDIAKKYDVSYRTVVNTKQTALRKLREILEKDGGYNGD